MQTKINSAEIVEKIANLLEDHYIFLDVARQMVARLRERLPDYDQTADAKTLAQYLTADLQGISHDKHLHVDYDPAGAAELLNETPDDARDNLWLKRIAADNYGFYRLEWFPGRIACLDLRWFAPPSVAGALAVAAMNWLANASAIIFDLRKNGGGSPEMIQLLTTYLFDDSEPRHLNSFYVRQTDSYTHFSTLPYVPGKRLPDVDVYVLTSRRTFSAAEEFTYNLKHMERATIIGETTGGGANPGGAFPLNDQFTIFVPNGRAINPITKTNWEGTGIAPHIDVQAEDALQTARVTALKKLLERTLGDEERQFLQTELDALGMI